MPLQLPQIPGFDVFMAGNESGQGITNAVQGFQQAYAQSITNELNKQKQAQNKLLMQYLPNKLKQEEQQRSLGLEKGMFELEQSKELSPLTKSLKETELDYNKSLARKERSLAASQYEKDQADINFKKSHQKLIEAQTKEAEEKTRKENAINTVISNSMKGVGNQEKPQSVYGIETPQITQEDIKNKLAYGIDSFTSRKKAAEKSQEEQKQGFMERSILSNKNLDSALKVKGLLNQYNTLMNEATFAGPGLAYIPAFGKQQAINNVLSQMNLGAIESFRNAMSSARFSNLDTNLALGLKPNLHWDEGTRRFFTEFFDATTNRLREKSQFDKIIASNPQLGLSNADSDRLWTAYQDHFPMSLDGKNIIQYGQNEFMRYLTPDAINSIKKTGDYGGFTKKDVTEDNIQDTMKATGLNRDEVIKKLKSKGIMK